MKIIWKWCQFWPPNVIVIWWKYKNHYYQRIFGIDLRIVYKKGEYHLLSLPHILGMEEMKRMKKINEKMS